jgi:molybdate transport system permease protein
LKWFALPLALTLAFLVVPVLAIFLDSPPGELLDALGEPGALDALWLSLRTSVTALAIIVVIGTPAA